MYTHANYVISGEYGIQKSVLRNVCEKMALFAGKFAVCDRRQIHFLLVLLFALYCVFITPKLLSFFENN
jgi:hypothetical protein